MTAISVIVPSNRIGGIDVLLSGLAVQTLPREEFELVLVDNLHARRKQIVQDMAEEYRLNVTHVPPMGIDEYPSSGGLAKNGTYQRALNTGIVHSRGRSILVMCDYTFCHPTCLALHASFHNGDHSGQSVSMGGEVWCADIRPIVHPDLPLRFGWYAPEMNHNPALYKDATHVPSYQPWMSDGKRLALIEKWSKDYMDSLANGELDPWLYSTFGTLITPTTDMSQFRIWQKDKSETAPGLVHHQLMNLKQNSFATEDLLAVSGLNELMDGCHGHQDSELAGRLEAQRKTQFWLVHAAKCTLLDPHGLVIVRDMQKSEYSNLGIYNAGWKDDFKTPIQPQLDLRKKREEVLRGRTSEV